MPSYWSTMVLMQMPRHMWLVAMTQHGISPNHRNVKNFTPNFELLWRTIHLTFFIVVKEFLRSKMKHVKKSSEEEQEADYDDAKNQKWDQKRQLKWFSCRKVNSVYEMNLIKFWKGNLPSVVVSSFFVRQDVPSSRGQPSLQSSNVWWRPIYSRCNFKIPWKRQLLNKVRDAATKIENLLFLLKFAFRLTAFNVDQYTIIATNICVYCLTFTGLVCQSGRFSQRKYLYRQNGIIVKIILMELPTFCFVRIRLSWCTANVLLLQCNLYIACYV